jgi:hypothetical protein
MKKLLLNFALLLAVFGLKAQNCSDIFFSQYVEGYGNNKALGIYNPTPNPIHLNNQYRMIRYSNGSSAAAGEANTQAMINLGSHTIASGKEWVIVIDLVDPAGTGQNMPVDTALQAKADTFLCPVYNTSYTMYFNGNDALSIQKTLDNGNTWQYVDIFAQIGDPNMTSNDGTGGWCNIFPYECAYEAAWTYRHTLIRKSSVMQGTIVNPNPFIVSDQWDSLLSYRFGSPLDSTIQYLGHHKCDCPTGAGINEIDNSVSIQLFPNPVSNNNFTITSSEFMQAIEINNVIGQQVLRKETKHSKQFAVETGNIPKGIYSARIYFSEGKTKTVKLIVQ